MRRLVEGARQLPQCHLSVRVPWNDPGWEGVVCREPSRNTCCLVLPRIGENRDDEAEERVAGESWSDLYSTNSQPLDKPDTGKIAVKVINHYGDEVFKVYEVTGS